MYTFDDQALAAAKAADKSRTNGDTLGLIARNVKDVKPGLSSLAGYLVQDSL